jgi:hypothetical protein
VESWIDESRAAKRCLVEQRRRGRWQYCEERGEGTNAGTEAAQTSRAGSRSPNFNFGQKRDSVAERNAETDGNPKAKRYTKTNSQAYAETQVESGSGKGVSQTIIEGENGKVGRQKRKGQF